MPKHAFFGFISNLNFALGLGFFQSLLSYLPVSVVALVDDVSVQTIDPIISTSQPLISLQDVNILAVTDVHSWVAGHSHNHSLDVDYGDVLSFYERLNATAAEQQKDLFFVMNGDWIDGTGISTNPPKYLTPILEKMPWDAVNVGNHELYKNSTIEFITQEDGLIDFWKGRYLSSNIYVTDTNEFLGERYLFLQGKFSGKSILFFGFLFNFQNHCDMTEVVDVETAVNEPWFTNVVSGQNGSYDAIVVLAHMDADDSLVSVILDKIRSIAGPSMPVQFITGHSHQRKFNQTDSFSTSFEAGHYLDTIGFTSFSLDETSANFEHKFIDAETGTLKQLLGLSESENLKTPNGQALTDLIIDTQNTLGLNERLGCSPQTYYLMKGLEEPDSLWGFYSKTIVPKELFAGNESKLFVQTSGGFRYNLYEGNFTMNDLVTVSPFDDDIYLAAQRVKGSEFLTAFGEPNIVDKRAPSWGDIPKFVVAGTVKEDKLYDVYTVDFNVEYIADGLHTSTGRKFHPEKVEGLSTNGMIRKYAAETWFCNEDDVGLQDESWTDKFRDFFESFTVVKMIAFILTFFVIIFFGWMFLCRYPHQKIPDDYDDQSYDDDSGMISISDEDEVSSVFPIGEIFSNGSRSYQSIAEENSIV